MWGRIARGPSPSCILFSQKCVDLGRGLAERVLHRSFALERGGELGVEDAVDLARRRDGEAVLGGLELFGEGGIERRDGVLLLGIGRDQLVDRTAERVADQNQQEQRRQAFMAEDVAGARRDFRSNRATNALIS